jgi:hypothetical protein
MVGVIVNWYTKDRHEVEIIELESRDDGRHHLVNAREWRAGKVWLHIFTCDNHTQSAEMVNRITLIPVEVPRGA